MGHIWKKMILCDMMTSTAAARLIVKNVKELGGTLAALAAAKLVKQRKNPLFVRTGGSSDNLISLSER